MNPNRSNAVEELPIELTVEEAHDKHPGDNVWLLDVREPLEFEAANLAPDGFIPLGEIGERWMEVPAEKEVIVYCHHGLRSLVAAKFLRERGVSGARSLKGGIDQWSLRIDPAVPRY